MEKMYNLVIIDDENIVLDYLENQFNWNKIGFNVVGAFYDGETALNFIDNNDVDAVLSDIKMNGVDGMEIVERLREHHSNIKVVLLSGYSNYDYMKNAITNKVFDYLLKPCKYKEIVDVFTRLYEVIKSEKSDMEYSDVVREKMFNELGSGKISLTDDIRQKVALCGKEKYNYDTLLFSLVFIEINQYDDYAQYEFHHADRLSYIMNNILKMRNASSVLFNRKDGNCEMIILDDSTEADEFDVKIEQATQYLKNIMLESLDINVEVNHTYPEKFDLFPSIYAADVHSLANTENICSKIVDCMTRCDGLNLVKWLKYLFSDIDDIKTALSCSKMILSISNRKIKEGILDSGIAMPYIAGCKNCLEVQNCLLDYAKKHIAKLSVKQETFSEDIDKIIQYIDENIYDYITLENVAEKFSFNSAYFSRFFKKKTGKRFIDYVTERKIEEAKKLLRYSDEKIVDISQKLNYASMPHFLKIFRKYVGMTPTGYRRIGGNEK